MDRCVQLGLAMCAESPTFAGIGLSAEVCTDLLQDVLDNPDHQCWLVAEDDNGEIVGMMGGYVTTYYFGTKKLAQDYLLYVQPNTRGAITAKRLVGAFEEWAKDRGVTRVQPGVTAGIDDIVAGKLYERLGYQPMGRLYMKEV